LKLEWRGDTIEVHLGDSGEVRVPVGSSLKVYAGKSADVRNIRGRVVATAGRDLRLQGVQVLTHASAGGSMDLDCDRLEGDNFKFEAGRDLRFFIRNLANAKLMINDLGGYWEAVLGDGRTQIRLKAGGDVTLVTDQDITSQPPYDVIGKVERPSAAVSENNLS